MINFIVLLVILGVIYSWISKFIEFIFWDKRILNIKYQDNQEKIKKLNFVINEFSEKTKLLGNVKLLLDAYTYLNFLIEGYLVDDISSFRINLKTLKLIDLKESLYEIFKKLKWEGYKEVSISYLNEELDKIYKDISNELVYKLSFLSDSQRIKELKKIEVEILELEKKYEKNPFIKDTKTNLKLKIDEYTTFLETYKGLKENKKENEFDELFEILNQMQILEQKAINKLNV